MLSVAGFPQPCTSEATQSCPTLATPWTVAYEVLSPMEFSWQEYWSGLPFPSPGDLPDPGIEPWFPTLQAKDFTTWATGSRAKWKRRTFRSKTTMNFKMATTIAIWIEQCRDLVSTGSCVTTQAAYTRSPPWLYIILNSSYLKCSSVICWSVLARLFSNMRS